MTMTNAINEGRWGALLSFIHWKRWKSFEFNFQINSIGNHPGNGVVLDKVFSYHFPKRTIVLTNAVIENFPTVFVYHPKTQYNRNLLIDPHYVFEVK